MPLPALYTGYVDEPNKALTEAARRNLYGQHSMDYELDRLIKMQEQKALQEKQQGYMGARSANALAPGMVENPNAPSAAGAAILGTGGYGEMPPQQIPGMVKGAPYVPQGFDQAQGAEAYQAQQDKAMKLRFDAYQAYAKGIESKIDKLVSTGEMDEGVASAQYKALASAGRKYDPDGANPLIQMAVEGYDKLGGLGLKGKKSVASEKPMTRKVPTTDEKGNQVIVTQEYDYSTKTWKDVGSGARFAPPMLKDIPEGDMKYLTKAMNEGRLTAADVTGRFSTKARAIIAAEKEAEKSGKKPMNYSADIIERKADASSLAKQTYTTDQLVSFVSNLKLNAIQASDIADKLTRTNTKLLNIPIRVYKESIKGTAEENELDMILTEISSEASKITSSAVASVAAPSEGLRDKWQKIHDRSLPIGELKKVLVRTVELAEQREGTVLKQLNATKSRIRPDKKQTSGLPSFKEYREYWGAKYPTKTKAEFEQAYKAAGGVINE